MSLTSKDSFFDYMESGYTPGEVYRYTRGSMAQDPILAGKYMEAKLYKFQPAEKKDSFSDFMAMARNPDALFQSKLQMPTNFVNAMGRMSFG